MTGHVHVRPQRTRRLDSANHCCTVCMVSLKSSLNTHTHTHTQKKTHTYQKANMHARAPTHPSHEQIRSFTK